MSPIFYQVSQKMFKIAYVCLWLPKRKVKENSGFSRGKQQKQRDPSLETEAKTKSTVNTFFLARHESWVSGKLLDFEFLFDQSNPQAQEDYAYERGLMYYFLEAHTFRESLLYRYEYVPKFYEIKSNGREATVVMRPNAKIFRKSVN